MLIRIPLKPNQKKILEDVKAKILSSGGQFTGTTTTGSFKIMGVSGTYKTEEKELVIHITNKPFFLSESFITSEINKYFNNIN